jgi:TolA-binding protein
MNSIRIVLCHVAGLVVVVSLLGGCSSNRFDQCLQEKQELQKSIESQQVKIDKLETNLEETNGAVEKISKQLQRCQQQRVKLMQGKGRNPETKRVAKKNPRRKTQGKAKSTKKKSGCPCSRKRRK